MIEQPDSEKPQEVSIPLGLTTPPGEPEPQWTGIARVLDHTGDTRIQWRKTDPEETAAAQARFDEYRRKSYVAYRLNESGTQGEQMDAFDPSAERVILMPPMVGG